MLLLGWAALAWAQNLPPSIPLRPPSPAEELYLQLGSAALSKTRVYNIRGAAVDRPPLHITMEDGTIAFTEDVMGRVTGAFFEGEGEVLLIPPNKTERASMVLFTHAAILEERISSGYFRFNDATFAELQPYLRPVEDPDEFVALWNATARNLAQTDALRLLVSLSRFLPAGGPAGDPAGQIVPDDDRFFHARMLGQRLGTFDVFYDAAAREQIWAGQLKTVESGAYYDVWASFPVRSAGQRSGSLNSLAGEGGQEEALRISDYKIRAVVKPPSTLEAETELEMEVIQGGLRAVWFELSRFLQVQSVEADGKAIEFVHNSSLEGSERARRGNDLLAAVFPEALKSGQKIRLRFVYRGDVLSEAGGGLLYAGARGMWYPNRGLALSQYDMEFHFPSGWTLVATGKHQESVPATDNAGNEISRWISERPIPVAGFNLGRFSRATARAGDIPVETFAAAGVERNFPKLNPPPAPPALPLPPRPQTQLLPPPPPPLQPSPARNAQAVADASAQALTYYSRQFGPYPYGSLNLAQIPGDLSQGWPSLIFLSTYSFLTNEERVQLHMNQVEKIASNLIVAHETAHQWWGDLVIWSGYRDQWIVEALANYSALMLLETQNPEDFRALLDQYRDELLSKNKDGNYLMEAGAVALGTRLSSSQFPNGYLAISYGRGSWLFHMLRSMLRDAEKKSAGRMTTEDRAGAGKEEPFIRALRKLRQRYEGQAVTTRDLLHIFEEELPPSLWYEGKKSLDWFYEGWINGTAVPQFDLQKVKYTGNAGTVTVSGVIRQKYAEQGTTTQDLVTPVPVYAEQGNRSIFLGQVFVEGDETPFRLSAPPGTRKVVLDPNQTLLARVH